MVPTVVSINYWIVHHRAFLIKHVTDVQTLSFNSRGLKLKGLADHLHVVMSMGPRLQAFSDRKALLNRSI